MAYSTVGDLVKNVLADDMTNTILPVICDFVLVEGSMLINTADELIDKLDLVFEKSHSVELNKASGTPVLNCSLALQYKREKVPDTKAITDQATAANGAVTTSQAQDDASKHSLKLVSTVELNQLRAKVKFR